MKVYTRTGDRGETGLFVGGRVRKDHLRVEAYGEVDELNAMLGLVAALVEAEQEGELDRIATYLNFDMIGSPNYPSYNPRIHSGRNRACSGV